VGATGTGAQAIRGRMNAVESMTLRFLRRFFHDARSTTAVS
jgi:hypothetical protein